MTFEINETHDINLKSWIESANDPNTDFPIQNLPFVRFKFGRKKNTQLGLGLQLAIKFLTLKDAMKMVYSTVNSITITTIYHLLIIRRLQKRRQNSPVF